MVWTKCLWDEKDLTSGLLVFQSMRNPTVPPIGVAIITKLCSLDFSTLDLWYGQNDYALLILALKLKTRQL